MSQPVAVRPVMMDLAAAVKPAALPSVDNVLGTRAAPAGAEAITAGVSSPALADVAQVKPLEPAKASDSSTASDSDRRNRNDIPAASQSAQTSGAALPVVNAQWLGTQAGQVGVVQVQLPRQVIGTTSSVVLVQLPPQAAASAASSASGVKLTTVDNAPAPNWVQYSPQQGGLVVGKVPDGALPTQIKMTVGNQQIVVQLGAASN